MQTKEFSSGEYVTVKPLIGPARRFYRWFGVNWIVHPNLTGVGTATEKCYIYHRDSIGHAADKSGIKSPVGYNEEQDYSYARVSVFMGSKLLQNGGVVQVKHDGSRYVAS